MGKRLRRVLLAVVAMLGLWVATAAPVSASTNIDWIGVAGCGTSYFDADANGEPGQERLAVALLESCYEAEFDHAYAEVVPDGDGDGYMYCSDTTTGDGAAVCDDNAFKEGKIVKMHVCFYRTLDQTICSEWFYGIA